ncbi:hypothetical protein Tco_1066682 [Tanacetum coccineum]|uniref:Uncharacterized protein n=1 Tax=Tanacetum coccineum TaxID=301880 RepID=A0ABQ5HAP8_9ASTR
MLSARGLSEVSLEEEGLLLWDQLEKKSGSPTSSAPTQPETPANVRSSKGAAVAGEDPDFRRLLPSSYLCVYLQAQVTGKERIKAAFEEFKKYKDEQVSSRCAEMDVRLDALIMKCAESTEMRQAFTNVVSAGLAKVVPGSRPKSSHLMILFFPEVRAPKDPWAVKGEVPLEDAIAANKSWAEKKKKCRVVCHTHGIGSAHHARSDGILTAPSMALSLYAPSPSASGPHKVLPTLDRVSYSYRVTYVVTAVDGNILGPKVTTTDLAL